MKKQKTELIKQIISKTEDEPELVEEQIAQGYRGYMPSNTEEESMGRWLRERNTPAMQGTIPYLNKDARLGNLPKNQVRMFDPSLLMLFTDVGELTHNIAIKLGQQPIFARKVFALRDYAINLSASSGGFEIIQQNSSNVNINKAMNEPKTSPFEIFKRKGQEQQR